MIGWSNKTKYNTASLDTSKYWFPFTNWYLENRTAIMFCSDWLCFMNYFHPNATLHETKRRNNISSHILTQEFHGRLIYNKFYDLNLEIDHTIIWYNHKLGQSVE